MKIIFTVATYYPQKDGVSHVTQYLAEGLAKKGHSVVVFTRVYGTEPVSETHNKVEIIRFNIRVNATIYFGDKKKYIHSIINETQNTDVLINVCTQTPTTDWLLDDLEKINCYKILYMHGKSTEWSDFSLLNIKKNVSNLLNYCRWNIYYPLIISKLKKYDKIIQLHEMDSAYIYLNKKGFSNQVVIGNAVDNDFFLNNKKNDIPNYIINVNNYCSRKNQMACLECFYKAETNNFELILIGSEKNSYYEGLVHMIPKLSRKYGKKRVRLLYEIKRKNIPKYVANASIYLMTSKWEAFPISLMEGMACGVPFITTNVGIVETFEGGFCDYDYNEITKHLTDLCSDSYKREKLSKQAKNYALNHFTQNEKIDYLESQIKELVGTK